MELKDWMSLLAPLLLLPAIAATARQTTVAYGPELQGFEYPYPVRQFEFVSQQQLCTALLHSRETLPMAHHNAADLNRGLLRRGASRLHAHVDGVNVPRS